MTLFSPANLIAIMKEILKESLLRGMTKLPDAAGVMNFWGASGLLMCELAGSLSGLAGYYFGQELEDRHQLELVKHTQKISYQKTSSMFGALLGKKAVISRLNPPYNQLIRAYDNYQYLGLNFLKPPFLKVENTTVNDYFYLGPFRRRFFLHDVIDTLMGYAGTPACPGRHYPCELLDNGNCRGYCQNQKGLKEALIQYYLLPQSDNLNKMQEKQEELLDDLNFEEAEDISARKNLLLRYYNQVSFLMVTKGLNLKYNYQGKEIEIKNGLISRIEGEDFGSEKTEYMPNELYAVEKSELDERWIVFNEIKQAIPEKLMELYAQTRKELLKYMQREESDGK